MRSEAGERFNALPSGPRSGARGLALTIRDRIFVANTILLILTGVVILFRSINIGLTPLALIISGGFIGFGAYRLMLIRRYIKRSC